MSSAPSEGSNFGWGACVLAKCEQDLRIEQNARGKERIEITHDKTEDIDGWPHEKDVIVCEYKGPSVVTEVRQYTLTLIPWRCHACLGELHSLGQILWLLLDKQWQKPGAAFNQIVEKYHLSWWLPNRTWIGA